MPKGWEWVRLGEVCKLLNGEKINDKNLPLLDVKFLRTKTEPKIVNSGIYIKNKDYLILVDGENSGEIFQVFCDGIMGSTFKKLFINKKLYLEYVLMFLNFNKDLFKQNKKGSAIPHLNKDIFNNLLLPLPPLAEQERIVNKIEKIEPYIELYEKYETRLTEINNSFPNDIKNSILQYAIQGC